MSEAETKVICPSPSIGPVASTPAVENLKAELVERPSSPEINCAICLEELRNKSYTNTCLHQFCFHCLLEWSKVKPECPLCKQSFSRIYHNIRSNEEYDEHVLDPPGPQSSIDPHIFINVAFQRSRFRYRSTMGGSMLWAFQGLDPLTMSTSWTPNNYPIDYSVPPLTGNRPVRLNNAAVNRPVTRSQRLGASEFRFTVYRQGLWVRPSTAARFRECSPEFYRLNPAQVHRLVPWLTRELNVLLELQYDTHTVCQDILNLISAHHINSSVFHRAMTFYLGSTAEHFIHEFYHFAISPHDMIAYDSHAQYAQVGRHFSSESDSDFELLNLPEPLVSLDLTAAPGPSGLQQTTTATTENSSTNGTSTNFFVIELSDDDEPRVSDPDSDIEIIGQLPPRHLRTPEVITIGTDSESECITETKPEPRCLVNLSSDEEDDDVIPEDVHPPENNSFSLSYQPTQCQCPMYDNCPYSREVTRMAQGRRNSYKREHANIYTASPYTSTSSTSSASSHATTDQDDLDVSSHGHGTLTRRSRQQKTRTTPSRSCQKNSLSSLSTTTTTTTSSTVNGRRAPKRKRSDESMSSSSSSSSSSTSSSSSASRSSDNQQSPVISSIEEEDSSSTSSSTSTSDDDGSSSYEVMKRRRQPVRRLKSIVLKVDKSKTSASSLIGSSTRYKRRHTRRIESSSESEG